MKLCKHSHKNGASVLATDVRIIQVSRKDINVQTCTSTTAVNYTKLPGLGTD